MKGSTGFTTPILFLIFNRPDTTARVWEVIRKIQPKYLYVAADGARASRMNELEKTTATRRIIQPDWDCELVTLYRNENLGCRNSVSQAITWFFEQVEEGIILEDDCLPDETFFNYCAILLEKYRDEPKVMHIGGCNFQDGIKRGNASYYFSRYNHIWGWASWRRAWKLYDVEMKDYPAFSKSASWGKIFFNAYEEKRWRNKFQSVYDGSFDTWDYQWTYAMWKNGSIAISPQVNLVSNIGFSADATHTVNKNDFSDLSVGSIKSWKWADTIEVNQSADKYTFVKFQCTTLVFKLKFYFFEILALFRSL